MFWIFCIVFLLLFTTGLAAWSFAPWLPSRRGDVERVISIAALAPGDTLYDLGCGDGRLVFAVAMAGARGVGIELALPLYLWCLAKKMLSGASRAVFRYGDFFRMNISDATVVYVFGLSGKMGAKLVGKFRQQLKPGSRVISYVFPLEGMLPERVDKPSEKHLSLYLYRF